MTRDSLASASSFRVPLLVAVCAAVVLALGLFAYSSLATLSEGTAIAAAAERGHFQIAQVLQTLTVMGGGVRHFEATRDKDSFEEAAAAAAQLPEQLTTLQLALADDPRQRPFIAELTRLAGERQTQTRQVIDRALKGDTAGVEALVAEGEGTRIIEASRALIAKMQDRQSKLSAERALTASRARTTLDFAIGATTVLATLLLVLVGYGSTRHNARLRRSQEELSTTLRSIGDAVISTDASGSIRFMNVVAEQLTGWTTEAARGSSLQEVFRIIHESTREPVENPVTRVLREHCIIALANHTVLVARGGDERSIEDSAAPIYGYDGDITGVVLAFRDVTNQRAAQQALLASEANLREANVNLERRIAERTAQLVAREVLIRTFYQHSSECHAVLAETSAGGFRYEEVNPATLNLYGKNRDEVIGRTVDEIFDPDAANELNRYLKACLGGNGPYRYERAQGAAVLEAIATPVPHEAGVGRRIVISERDVTERRRLEQQLMQSQKMEAVGQLTGGLAHDFNNLLVGITGALELIKARVAQGRFNDLDRYVAAGQGAARRAAALTHRLLAFSRRQTLDPKPTDVNRLVADMVELIRRTVGPEIRVDIVGAIELWNPSVDANQLENALLNLCINARDAMPTGGKITIETANRWIDERAAKERDLTAGQYISLCVSDTGCGMSPEVVARAFDPFFTTKPLGQGTGLGLSMIYGFARQSGGQVRIYSEVGQGAMVCIYLPRHPGHELPAEPLPDAGSIAPTASGETVLVVDDEPLVRMLVTEVLQDLGYRAIECEDGVSALKVLESARRVDLMVTDVGLPNGLNGRQLADAGRAIRSSLKVLFITGYAENAVFSHGHLDSGFEVLTKPFAMDVLANRISGMMNRAE
jgi:PAS domain S-box-containing protein